MISNRLLRKNVLLKRKVGDEWVCYNERAEFLKEHNAVEILDSIQDEKQLKEEPKKEVKLPKKKVSKK